MKQHRDLITEIKQVEEELQWNYDVQTVINTILSLSLEDINLEEILRRTLNLILSLPWLAFESKGAIFLVEDNPEVLVMKAQDRLSETIQKACARVPFGRCVCGQAALTRTVKFSDRINDHHETIYNGIIPHGHYCAPILYAGKVLGVINLYVMEDHRYDQREEQFLTVVANTLASVIARKQAEASLEEERNQLARRVEERTAELRTVNAELTRANRLKNEFLANMSHELRTPLNAILGLSELLQMEVYGSLNKKQSESLKSIEESGRHLLDMINDILDVSKIEVGKLELEVGMVDIELVCQASLRLIKQDSQNKQLQVSTSIDRTVKTIFADGRRLKQILLNLLSNAVKFTPNGGEIGLVVTGDSERQAVYFTVWDTGVGISQENIELLFKPFTQVDSKLSRQYNGTGLGLALVRRLVELHGGTVSVESEPGKGSRFIVSLPWRGAVSEASPSETDTSSISANVAKETTDEAQEAKQRLILLAEDDENSINFTSDYLLSEGYRVAVARNGVEAIQQAREKSPDLILMDIQMPGMDGLETIRRIRADAALGNTPIIALTALAMPGDRERCLEAGANDYISKPIRLYELVKAIRSQLNQSQIDIGSDNSI